jgi:predicted nucleic acid-binding protein
MGSGGMFLLDSCIFEYLRRPDSDKYKKMVRNWIDSRDETELFLSVVTIAEKAENAEKIRRDAARIPKKAPRVQSERALAAAETMDAIVDELEASFGARVISINLSVAKLWGQMRCENHQNTMDAAIAAVARAYRYIVVTVNAADFEKHGVQIVNPLKQFDRKTGLNI